MRRHIEDRPSLSNSTGVFNSSSLPLSAAASTNSTSRVFTEIDARVGASNSNIPLTTTITTTASTVSSLAFHHSNRTLNAPVSPGTGSSSSKPLIPRQPLALIQETVHAVGSGGNSEMQSGVQFSLPSGYQTRVAAATTLSQGNLGHNQTSVHHSLSVQAQAHSNSQIVHPIQTNSQAHVAQMQGHQMQFQRLKVEDALSYLDQVKYKFGSQPQVYNDFLDIMKEFKSQSIDTPGVIQRVSNLFRGYPELIVGFNTFLPLGYRIEVSPNEQVQVSIPGTNLGAGGVSTGPTSLTIHPTGPPSATPIHPTHGSQSNHTSHASSPHTSPGSAANKSSSHSAPVTNNQSHTTNSQNQHIYNQNSPAHTQSSGGSSGVHSPNSTPQTSQPVEFNHAINYVNKIKNRFQGQPDIYKQFLEILHTYQKEQRNLKDGIHTGTKPLTEAEVYAQVAKLFQNQEDLLQEFGQFLPDANGAANALGLQPPKSVNNEHSSAAKKPSLPIKPVTPANNQSKQIQAIKRPAPSVPSPPIKKPKMTSLKDVTLAEATKYGSLNEFAFFDKVRKTFKSPEIYENFLRCLVIYNQELISRTDLVLLVNPFLAKHPDLFKWFKDFLGYKETNNNVEVVPKKIETQERERVIGDFATEIDYSSCVKYGASYRAVPRNYVQPKCSGRTALCREVLNDTWVSFPSWSEDSTFVSSRKTQFEEYIYRCEDERFELDVVLETNLSTIRILEAEMTKMNRMSPEEKARYRLDDTLGGSSTVIQQRAIKRIYGDKANDIIEGLKKNPVSAVPLVLRRLKAKEEEWRKAQKSFNKIWREQNEKYYLKSLDHQGINFKQNDVKYLKSNSIINEIENLYKKRRDQADEGLDVPSGPHLTLTYKNKEIFRDAANLIIHHVKRQTGIHKEDKQRIKQLMRQFFPDLFSVPRGDLSDDEMDKDEDLETEDGNESPKSNIYRDLLSINFACGNNHSFNHEASKIDRICPSQDEKSSDKTFFGSIQSNSMDNSLPDESYTLMFVNNYWYIFFRLHHILCERLWKIHERAQVLIAEELKDQEERKQSTAYALRLKPRNNIDVESYYSTFLEMVKNLLDVNIESSQYEDNLREMFGIHAYLGFTLDKVIQNLVRQLQHIVGDESCTQWTALFLEEMRNKATGGPCATTSQRAAAELAYQKKAEQMSDDNLFKVIVYKEERKLTIELLDTDSDTSEDQNTSNKWNAFVKKYIEEEPLVSLVRNQLTGNPVFLPRQISWYKEMRNKEEEKDSESPQENEISLQTIQDELDDSKIDLSRLEDGGAGEAVKGLVGLNAKAKYLERTRQNKITENSESSSPNYGCKFNVNSYKMTWIVDSENCLYRKESLYKALQSHRKVSQNLNRRFREWHKKWLKENVDDDQEKKCMNWLLGLCEDTLPTTCIRVENLQKPPYSPYNRYKVREKT